MSYHQMQNVASYAAGKSAYRENYVMGSQPAGRAGGNIAGMCAFAPPPKPRCNCGPAAFSSVDGANHHRLLAAYGNSIPCTDM